LSVTTRSLDSDKVDNMLPSSLKVWLLQVFTIPILCTYHDLQQAVAAFTPQLSSGAVVTFPWEPRWDALQARASFPRLAPHYTVVVEVATEEDVQATVSLANRLNIPFLAVSGTHGLTSTLDSFPYGVQINLRKLNTTTLSHDGKSAVVGGGTLQREITRSLFAKGKAAGKTSPRIRFYTC
jgi:FAD/FMN-containing dehydrogenase